MAGYYDQLMQAGGGTVPPSQSDPWAWAQWARTQDPSTYNLGGGRLTDDPNLVKTSAGMLRAAGLWKPEWDDWARWQEGTGEGDGGLNAGNMSGGQVPDLSSLAGYEVQNTRGPGYSAFLELLGPDGRQAGLEQYEQSGSWRSKDYLEMAAVTAAMVGGGMALNGGFAGAGASTASGAAAVAPGAATFPVVAGGTGWGGGALGAEGLTSSIAALNSMALPAVPTLTGAAGGAGVAAGAGAGINGYLTTGAVEGSTLGSFLTGAGGSAGAVGSGTSASFLQQLGSGVSSFLGGSGGTGGGLRSAFDIVSGIYGLNLARDARKASDPFGPYRGAYGAELAQLEANPTTITSRPGWQAGIEAIQRNNAARGYAGSGNEMAVMSRYGGEFFNNEANRLATLAGAGAAPGAGQFDAARLANLGVSSIGYGLAPYIGGAGGPK